MPRRSEMTSSGGQGAPSFYGPLRQHLNPGDEGEGAPGDYSDSVPECWELLSQWLDELLFGRRGFSTIRRHDHFVNIGYATQQAVLRTSDRRRLSRFFRSIGLQPGEEDVVASELRQALRVWAKRQGPAGTRLFRSRPSRSCSRMRTSCCRSWLSVGTAPFGMSERERRARRCG